MKRLSKIDPLDHACCSQAPCPFFQLSFQIKSEEDTFHTQISRILDNLLSKKCCSAISIELSQDEHLAHQQVPVCPTLLSSMQILSPTELFVYSTAAYRSDDRPNYPAGTPDHVCQGTKLKTSRHHKMYRAGDHQTCFPPGLRFCIAHADWYSR